MTTYKEAGVDIENTDALVEDISELSKSTNRNGNYDKIGGFGGIFDLKNCGYEDPLLFVEKTVSKSLSNSSKPTDDLHNGDKSNVVIINLLKR